MFSASTTTCQVVAIPVTCGFSCDPLTQQGCDPGQKCTFVATSLDPLAGRTACVSDGTAAEGESCSFDGAGRDDCVAGLWCYGTSDVDRACRTICNDAQVGCVGASCTVLDPAFFKIEGDGFGVCLPGA